MVSFEMQEQKKKKGPDGSLPVVKILDGNIIELDIALMENAPKDSGLVSDFIATK